MTKIKKIESIFLSKLNFDKNEEVYDDYQKSDVENSLIAELNAKIEKIGFHEPDDGQYRAFLSLSGVIKVQEEGNQESNTSSILAEVLIAYQLNFETNQSLYPEGSNRPALDENISDELRRVIEPYYREMLQSIFDRASLEMPPLPYGVSNQKNE